MSDVLSELLELRSNPPIGNENLSAIGIAQKILQQKKAMQEADSASNANDAEVEKENEKVAEESVAVAEATEEKVEVAESSSESEKNEADNALSVENAKEISNSNASKGRPVYYTDKEIKSFEDVFSFVNTDTSGIDLMLGRIYCTDVRRIQIVSNLFEKKISYADIFHNILNLYFEQNKEEISEFVKSKLSIIQ